jgi:3-oxoadipate enol-lactonase
MSASLDFTTYGDAARPPLLLGNSLGTTSQMWSAQIPELEQQFYVIAYDHPGHGKSESSAEPCEISDLGRAVVSVLDEVGVSRASYAGVSLGGMVGLWLAANTDRVDRLVVICTSAHLAAPDYWRERAAKVRANGMTAIVDPVVERWFTPTFARRHPHVVRDYKEMLAQSSPMGYAACCEAIGRLDLRADLAKVSAPTTVVAGADDQAIPPEHGAAIAKAVAGSLFVTVADAAHLANVEQPAVITRLLLDQLSAKG